MDGPYCIFLCLSLRSFVWFLRGLSLSLSLSLWLCLCLCFSIHRPTAGPFCISVLCLCLCVFLSTSYVLQFHSGMPLPLLWASVAQIEQLHQGRPSPEALMHFLPVSDSPLFPTNFSIFNRQNFGWPFLVVYQKFRIPPYFRYFNTFPTPLSTKLFILSPYFKKSSPLFSAKFTCFFLHTLCIFRFPILLPWCICASHNARTGRPSTPPSFNSHSQFLVAELCFSDQYVWLAYYNSEDTR